MNTITIPCQDPAANVLDVELSHLLLLAGQRGWDATWKIVGLEAFGPAAEPLHDIADSGRTINGRELVALAVKVDQVVDGEFIAYDRGQKRPWLILRAVDSTCWDVASPVEAVLDAFRSQYSHVKECGDVA